MGKATPQDPSGQATNSRVAARRLISRLTLSERAVLALFRDVPRVRRSRSQIGTDETTVFYDYDYPPAAQEAMTRDVKFILNNQLLETQGEQMPFTWFWNQDIDRATRQGTLEEVRDFNQMTAAAIAAGLLLRPVQPVPPEQVIFSEDYRNTVQSARLSAFGSARTISDRTAGQVLQRLNAGISGGKSPLIINRDLKERFGVADASARRTAVTEINQAYNNARIDSTRILGFQTGLRAAVIHISALKSTTRPNHAARHGNAYTLPDQLSWWETGTNRISCLCTTRSVLIDAKGEVIDGSGAEEIKTEGREFFRSQSNA